jgi:hypothetical protein
MKRLRPSALGLETKNSGGGGGGGGAGRVSRNAGNREYAHLLGTNWRT